MIVVIARILLGLIFFLSGVSGFLPFMPPPPPGMAGAFFDVYFHSHWIWFVDGVQLIAGALLLANRYVPFALVVLAAVIYNMLVFHITMQPVGVIGPLVLLGLWFVVARPLRSHFAPLFVQKTPR